MCRWVLAKFHSAAIRDAFHLPNLRTTSSVGVACIEFMPTLGNVYLSHLGRDLRFPNSRRKPFPPIHLASSMTTWKCVVALFACTLSGAVSAAAEHHRRSGRTDQVHGEGPSAVRIAGSQRLYWCVPVHGMVLVLR